jgi:hypothetical protein
LVRGSLRKTILGSKTDKKLSKRFTSQGAEKECILTSILKQMPEVRCIEAVRLCLQFAQAQGNVNVV